MKTQRGQIIIVILILAVVIGIIIPYLVYLVRHESKWTVMETKSTRAFHLAEAGQDRGIYKLRESSTLWDMVAAGQPIGGYDGNTIYSDISGGEYKIIITSGPNQGEVTITAKGRDKARGFVRSVVGIYSKRQITTAVQVDEAIEYKPNMIVHWGPVVSFTNMDLEGNQATIYYPRKFSMSAIENRDENPSEPNSDGFEYWAYEELENSPEVDLQYYKQQAINSVVPEPKKTGDQSTEYEGTGYFDGGGEVEFSKEGGVDYIFDNSSATIYIEGNCKIKDGAFLRCNLLILDGSIHVHGNGINHTVTIPTGASNEYKHTNAWVSVWQTLFDDPGNPDDGEGSNYVISDCAFHGFLYVHGNFHCSGGVNSIVGVIKVKGDMKVNTMTIYYDPVIAEDIKLLSSQIERSSWLEVVLSW